MKNLSKEMFKSRTVELPLMVDSHSIARDIWVIIFRIHQQAIVGRNYFWWCAAVEGRFPK